MSLTRYGALFLCSAVLSACGSVPERTVELDPNGPGQRYVTNVDDADSRKDTLFIVTASGGGTRAAALTLGALRTLKGFEFNGRGKRTLLDEVDIVSSVSGGSVTAAYFALKGAGGFKTLEDNFLRQDGIGEIIARGLNPVTFARMSTDSYSRLDLLVDYFEERLFGEATFADLPNRRPYLILNAGDMSGGTVFSFTPSQFDLLCADLSAFKLSEAVAASAAFPVALAPLAIRNHSPCRLQLEKAKQLTGSPGDRDRQPRWPPIWIQNAVGTAIEKDPNGVRLGRSAFSYLNLDCGTPFDADGCEPAVEADRRQWIHLLDGGIADNLGLNEPLLLISSEDVEPRFLNKIFGVAGEENRQINNLVFLVVNARSAADSTLDQSGETPGIFSMLNATTGSAIDAASFGMLDRLSSIVRELLLLRAGKTKFLQQKVEQLKVLVVPVDFDYIEKPDCRRYFKNIATSWTLKGEKITALNDIAGALMRQSSDFETLRKIYGLSADGGKTVADVCSGLKPK